MTTRSFRVIRFVTLSLSLSALSGAQTAAEASAAAQQMMRTALANLSTAANGGAAPPAASVQQSLGFKKPGVKRVGIFMPESEMGVAAGPAAGEPIREMEGQFLTGPGVEIVKIAALLPQQAYAEAKASDCDYVLTSAVSQKKSSGGFGGLKTFSALAPMASMVPGVGVGAAMMGMAATQSLAAASSTAAGSVKAKSEVTLEFSLNSLDGAALLSDVQKAKSKSDGDDVLTPMVRKAAVSIMKLLTAK